MSWETELEGLLSLPSEPELAYAEYHRRMREIYDQNVSDESGWYFERQFVDKMIAFDLSYELGIFDRINSPPGNDTNFSEYFQTFSRVARVNADTFLLRHARKIRLGTTPEYVLNEPEKAKIHQLISKIREQIGALEVSDDKRDALFDKLNSFAAEVDRERTRPESFFSLLIQAKHLLKGKDEEKSTTNLWDVLIRVVEVFGESKTAADALPDYTKKPKIGQQKQITSDIGEDEIPF